MRSFKRAKTGSLAVTDKPEQAIRHLAMAMDRVEAYLEQLSPSIRNLMEGFKPDSSGDYVTEIENLRARPIAETMWQLPVDSVFISFSPTNPATTLGYGTWELTGSGRVLIGQETLNPYFDEPGETGGSW